MVEDEPEDECVFLCVQSELNREDVPKMKCWSDSVVCGEHVYKMPPRAVSYTHLTLPTILLV